MKAQPWVSYILLQSQMRRFLDSLALQRLALRATELARLEMMNHVSKSHEPLSSIVQKRAAVESCERF